MLLLALNQQRESSEGTEILLGLQLRVMKILTILPVTMKMSLIVSSSTANADLLSDILRVH